MASCACTTIFDTPCLNGVGSTGLINHGLTCFAITGRVASSRQMPPWATRLPSSIKTLCHFGCRCTDILYTGAKMSIRCDSWNIIRKTSA